VNQLSEIHFKEAAKLAERQSYRVAMNYLFVSAGFGHLAPSSTLVLAPPEAEPLPETYLMSVYGKATTVVIEGVTLKAFETEEYGTWVSRADIGVTMGRNASTLTKLNPRGKLLPRLHVGGYSNKIRHIPSEGVAGKGTKCISMADARIAVLALQNKLGNLAA